MKSTHIPPSIAIASLGLAGNSMSGSSAAAPANSSPDAFNSWNVEAFYLHERARGIELTVQDFTDGVRLAES